MCLFDVLAVDMNSAEVLLNYDDCYCIRDYSTIYFSKFIFVNFKPNSSVNTFIGFSYKTNESFLAN